MAEENKPVVLTFGGGVNARQRSADINIQECTEGQNFDLNYQSAVLKGRQPIGIVVASPNGEPIRGIIQLVDPDGTLSTIIQAGGEVFSWDGADTFVKVGTVDPAARLRGPIDSNFTLDAFIIITDLAKIENVKKWNGETFQDLEHNLGVDFKAKYVTVQTERAIFANVKTGTVDTPHVILASKQGDSEILTSTTRPAAAASAEDEWFLPTPDLRPINGITFFAQTLLLSTERGRLYALEGLIAGSDTDGLPFTSIKDFHAGSAVSGDEALINIGNDVAMGLPGRIETLSGIIQFGDVETNDASWWISPLLDGTFGEKVTSWALAYDQVGQRVFCFPNTGGEAWVLHKSLLFGPNRQKTTGGQNLSPWSKWVPSTELNNFSPTAIGNIFDQTEDPRLIASSPANSSSAGPATPTLFFGFLGGTSSSGGIFKLKAPFEEPPQECACDVNCIPTMTSNTSPSGEASASSFEDGGGDDFKPFQAFDGTNVTEWESEDTTPVVWSVAGSIEVLQYEFDRPTIIRAYFWRAPSSGSGNPASFTFEGSQNGTSWTIFDEQERFTSADAYASPQFNNNIGMRFYRLVITDVAVPNSIGLTSIQTLEMYSCIT